MYQQVDKSKPIIQKYGGTSVGTTERIQVVAERIARIYGKGHTRLGIVVSARSGMTNQLVGLIDEVNPKASGRAYDMAIAAGEQVSVGLLCAAIELHGIKARPLLAFQLGIRTDEVHEKARIHSLRRDVLEQTWDDGEVAVIAGFQGITPDGQLTTLGRGGSDTSAVAVACGVEASFCEINTDVDGVYTADPRYIKDARLLSHLDYDVALEMASLGSKVLHPRCVELGSKYGMPIVVRNSFKPDDSQRTRVMPFSEEQALEALVVSGVTLDRDVAKITIRELKVDSKTIAQIFSELAKQSINIDIIVHNLIEGSDTMRLGFTVCNEDAEQAAICVRTLAERINTPMIVETETGFCKVSAVGVGMRSHSGVAGRAFGALSDASIPIHMISTSEIKISCVVHADQAELAVQALHHEFVG
jgi:aspartate kinase